MTILHPDIVRNEIAQLRLIAGELEADEEAWIASLESETSLPELADKLIDRERECAALAGACESRIAELKLRSDRLTEQGKRIRSVMCALLQAAGLRKLERPQATLSIAKGRERLEIPDESAVPDEWCRIKKEADRSAIKDALKAGQMDVNWAALVRGDESLSVRTK